MKDKKKSVGGYFCPHVLQSGLKLSKLNIFFTVITAII